VKQRIGAAAEPVPVQPVDQECPITLIIYVAHHCSTCDYSYEVAAAIRREFPQVNIQIVDLEQTTEVIPDVVFATPTYLLNGRVWSLGNPSPAQVQETLSRLSRRPDLSAAD
jgi:hypothetical protein